MKHTTSFVIVFACALFISFAAFGQTAPPEAKWSQPPDMLGYDWSSETQVPSAVADDWLCENGMPINQITWWGSYYAPAIFPYNNSDNYPDPTMPNNTPPGTVTGFNIGIFSDKTPDCACPWGMPDEILYLTFISIEKANETLFGVATKPGGQQENVWQYTAQLDELFYQEQGVTYWLAIQAVNGDNTTFAPMIQWGWHQTDKLLYGYGEDAVQLWQYSESDGDESECWNLLVDTEMAFELYTIPEPSTITLILSSLGMAGIFMRKRSK